MNHAKKALLTILLLGLVSLATAHFAAAQPLSNQQIAQTVAPKGRPVTIRGKIAAFEGQTLRVTTPSGEVSVQLPEPLRVTGVAAAELADVKPGTYVGTAARKQADGTFRALEVHIFREEARGTGAGHRPYDLPKTTMTNANVEKVEQIVVEKVRGPMLTLKYKGGEVKVFVPPDAQIVKLEPGSRELLKPGAGVVIPAIRGEDGSIRATRISVGVGGVMPPM